MSTSSPSPADPGAALPEAIFRSVPEDFVVEEIPAYAPSGSGEHLYVRFTKTRLTTDQAVRDLARHLGVDARSAGWAGMKDKYAVTTQTASFQFPIARRHEGAFDDAELPGIQILEVARHGNKLKPGHLVGNRFRITLRGLDREGASSIADGLRRVMDTGVPNHFGPQRFGRDGANAERALAWLAGRDRGPREPRDQRMVFSSLQSMMFNEVLDARVANGSWSTILLGDIAKKREGALFAVREPDLDDAVARAARREVSATGPMFGASMTWPEHGVLGLEESILRRFVEREKLDAFRRHGEGTRRSLRLEVDDLSVEVVDGPEGTDKAGRIGIAFVLPKGGYATTVLARVCKLIETGTSASSPRAPTPEDGCAEDPAPGLQRSEPDVRTDESLKGTEE